MLNNRNVNIGTCPVRLISVDIHKTLLLLSWVFYLLHMVLIKKQCVFQSSVLLLSSVWLEQRVQQSRSAAEAGCLLGGLKFVLIESKKKKIIFWHMACTIWQWAKKASDQWQLRWKGDCGCITRKQLTTKWGKYVCAGVNGKSFEAELFSFFL